MTAQSTLQISKQPEYDSIYEFDSLIAALKNMPKMAYSRDLPKMSRLQCTLIETSFIAKHFSVCKLFHP